MVTDPHGRFLLVLSYAFERQTALRLAVVRGSEVNDYIQSGWRIVVEDPQPDRYARGAREENDGA